MPSDQTPKGAAPRRTPARAASVATPAPAAIVAPASSGLAGSSPWAYAPAPESREIVTIRQRYGLFIDGKERAPSGGEVTITYNPATEEPLAEIAKLTTADADRENTR